MPRPGVLLLFPPPSSTVRASDKTSDTMLQRFFQKYSGFLRNLKASYVINNFLNAGRLKHNRSLYQRYGLKKNRSKKEILNSATAIAGGLPSLRLSMWSSSPRPISNM